jgi:hypothetical protein
VSSRDFSTNWISGFGLAGLKQSKSIAYSFFSFHEVPIERVLESGEVTACTGLVELDVNIHNYVRGREGGYEQTYISLGALQRCSSTRLIVGFAAGAIIAQ